MEANSPLDGLLKQWANSPLVPKGLDQATITVCAYKRIYIYILPDIYVPTIAVRQRFSLLSLSHLFKLWMYSNVWIDTTVVSSAENRTQISLFISIMDSSNYTGHIIIYY